MANKNVQAVQALHKAFNERDWASMQQLIADDCVFVDGRGTYRARSNGQRLLEGVGGRVLRWQDHRAEYYDAGDTVVAEFVGRGTNDGALGPMPATNRPVELPYSEIYHLGSEGKVTGGHALRHVRAARATRARASTDLSADPRNPASRGLPGPSRPPETNFVRLPLCHKSRARNAEQHALGW